MIKNLGCINKVIADIALFKRGIYFEKKRYKFRRHVKIQRNRYAGADVVEKTFNSLTPNVETNKYSTGLYRLCRNNALYFWG